MPSLFLEPEKIYHVYTCANGSENLFRTDENYRYFLRKYAEHIFPVAKTFAYCLMPNHLHLMIQIRAEDVLENYFRSKGEKAFQKFQTFGKLISKQFANLFSAYTQAYNKKYNRRGSLFNPNFKRKLVDDDAYFSRLITYIHLNPVHHGFVKDSQDWPHSSWHTYLLDKPTLLARDDGMAWFGSISHFIQVHELLKTQDVIIDFDH